MDPGVKRKSFPVWKAVTIGGLALAFVLLTAWQVAAKLESWPLSSYPMYSRTQAKTSTRQVLMGVTSDEEVALPKPATGPLRSRRLLRALRDATRSPKRRRALVGSINRTYEAYRKEHGGPELQGIRLYQETWRVRPGLAGIEKPNRRLIDALYLPPDDLTARFAGERKGIASPLPPRAVKPEDVIFELAEEHCQRNCKAVDHRFASDTAAIQIAGETKKAPGEMELRFDGDPGNYFLFVRMLSSRAPRSLEVSFDGKPLVKLTRNDFPKAAEGAFRWSSAEPGQKALKVRLQPTQKEHRLKLRVEGGSVLVDQVWLSRERRELPTFNEPVRRDKPSGAE